MIKNIFIFFLFSLSQILFAAWDDSALVSIPTDPHPFSDPFVASFENVAKMTANSTPISEIPHTNIIRLKNKDFSSGLKLLATKVDGRAPLTILFPGLGATEDSYRCTEFAKLFASRGEHLVVIPNAWTPHWIVRSGGVHRPGDIIEEAKLSYQVVKEIVEIIGRDNISQIKILGYSYGAFLASIISYLDSISTERLITGKVTLLNPPLDILLSLTRLDHYIDDSEYIWKGVLDGSIFKQLALLSRARQITGQAQLSEKEIVAMRALVAWKGFQSALPSAIGTYMNVKKVESKFPKDDYQKWSQHFRFRLYLEEYAPELIAKYANEYSTLRYWYELGKSKGVDYQIFTSEDDFLNTTEQLANFPTEDLIIYPHGGHLGLDGARWYQNLLSRSL